MAKDAPRLGYEPMGARRGKGRAGIVEAAKGSADLAIGHAALSASDSTLEASRQDDHAAFSREEAQRFSIHSESSLLIVSIIGLHVSPFFWRNNFTVSPYQGILLPSVP